MGEFPQCLNEFYHFGIHYRRLCMCKIDRKEFRQVDSFRYMFPLKKCKHVVNLYIRSIHAVFIKILHLKSN